MENKEIQIGLFGFGCVGQGLYDVLNMSQGLEARIVKFCVKDKNKKRSIDASNFTYDKEDILGRKDLDVVVELIDNANDAFEIVSRAMKNGVNVVTANKKMLAENFSELYKLQQENNVALIYEGSAGGSIPIIRNLEEYYDNELLSSLSGIVNGSTNYILSKMQFDNLTYEDALREAQENGFAEADPWLDVAGYDALYKLILLIVHAFGVILKPEDVLNVGIQNIRIHDIYFAREKQLRIKLLAYARKENDKIRAYVLPHFVSRESELFNVNYEYNAIEVEGAFSDKQMLAGKGAGSHPTGSAVLSDISALTYNYRYGYKKLKKNGANGTAEGANGIVEDDFPLKCYIRFSNPESLKELDILSIEEEYRSAKTNYVIANVSFKSLFNLKGNKDTELFVCVVED
ncbi:MAG: homoserine dehydrogenase [Flavobacteriales bacterium]|nr:homoserine dehydrogenase [Flavobacteriales bacterium]MCB9446929.1 homoserine dehydrogenase [Flavobacteriales bacterium]